MSLLAKIDPNGVWREQDTVNFSVKPYRDAERNTPISKLADILYKYSHNKIVEIDEDTARYLREHSARR